MTYTTIDIDTAEEKFSIHDHMDGACTKSNMLLFEGDTHLKTLELANVIDDDVYGYIVHGDLIVDGDLEAEDEEGMSLFVTGSLHARSIFSAGLEIVVLKDAHFTNYAIGSYNHGCLRVKGDLHAPYIINDDHDFSWEGKAHGKTINLCSEEACEPYEYGTSHIAEDAQDDGEVDIERLMEFIAQGKPVLK